MRNTALAILLVVLPVSFAAAEQPFLPKPDKPAASTKLIPLKGAGNVNACAAYGPGFIKVEGSDTCVKVGGNIDIEAAGRR
jgi:hypothetical protein